jgi:flagellar biosynthetic protein FliO
VTALRGLIAAALGLLLVLPQAALAVTDADVANIDTTDAGPDQATRLATGGAAGSGMRVLLGLAVVVAVIFAVWWLLKRTNRGRVPGTGKAGVVTVLSTTAVGPNRNLHLVRVGEDVLLLGATEHGITALHTLDHETAREQGLLPEDPDGDLLLPAGVHAIAELSAGAPRRGGVLEELRSRTVRSG